MDERNTSSPPPAVVDEAVLVGEGGDVAGIPPHPEHPPEGQEMANGGWVWRKDYRRWIWKRIRGWRKLHPEGVPDNHVAIHSNEHVQAVNGRLIADGPVFEESLDTLDPEARQYIERRLR